MKITVSKFAGFCFGVDRAIAMVDKNISMLKKPVFMLGELVHNEHAVKNLRAKGIKIIKNINDINNGTVIITAHGISPKIITQLKKKNVAILDTTCPWVKRAHEAAKSFEKNGRRVVIVGDKNHIEVRGIAGELKKPAIIISNFAQARKLDLRKVDRIGVVSQTTQNEEEFERITGPILNKAKNIRILKTICDATSKRQADVKRLAETHDRVIIIGSKNSANTQRLFQIAKKINKKSFLISNAKDLKKLTFKMADSIAISGGASTPKNIIEDMVQKLESQ